MLKLLKKTFRKAWRREPNADVKPVPRRFEHWERKSLHAKLRAAGWIRCGPWKPFGSRSWVAYDAAGNLKTKRSTRNAARIEGLIL